MYNVGIGDYSALTIETATFHIKNSGEIVAPDRKREEENVHSSDVYGATSFIFV